MIVIFNTKLDSEILIDETQSWIQFTPRHYEEKPFVMIEFKNFNFVKHAYGCEDCKKFMNAFGQESVDWYIKYGDKVFRLDTKEIGPGKYPHNEIKVTMSDFDPGKKITLIFHQIPIDKFEINSLLQKAIANENYESACILRDLLKE